MDLSIFNLLDSIGALAFAMSGATLAIQKRFDVFGVFVLAFVTSTGGGTLRDVLLGVSPVEWMRNTNLIIMIVVGATSAILFYRWMDRLNTFVYLFDAAGLGLFTMAGIEKGLLLELSPFMCMALGVINATFGGLLRDILSGEKPMLLTRNEIYAVASLAGGGLYFVLAYFEINKEFQVPLCVACIFLVRHITYRYNIGLPSLSKKDDA